MPAHAVTVAVDFGTTYSGYIYSFRGDQDKFYMPTWEMGTHLSRKTPTAVLTEIDSNGEHRFLKFGYEAQQCYVERKCDQQLSKKTCLFNRFKMILHRQASLTSETIITDITGMHEVKALNIFQMALSYLKGHCLQHLRGVSVNKSAKVIKEDDIMWVLTVPAIWTDQAKIFMRKAANQASLIPSEMSDRLLIALEPEAASYFCRKTESHNFSIKSGGNLLLKPDDVYMVLDAGGGTVDITVHRLTKEEKIEEVRAPSGGNWGGTQVDAQFSEIMNDILGQPFMEHCKENMPLVWLDLETDMEFNKRTAHPKNNEQLVITRISWDFGNGFREYQNEKLEHAFDTEEVHKMGVLLNKGSIIFEPRARDRLFEPVIEQIVDHVRDLLQEQELSTLSHIFLVGGFAQSAYLQDAVMANFKRSIKIYIPNDPELSVLKGAVMFGHNPADITCRVARKTYGTSVSENFVKGKHREDLKELVDGVEKCMKVFSVFVTKGETVKRGEKRSFIYHPLRADTTRVRLPMVVSDRKEVDYTDRPDVDVMAETLLDMPDVTKGKDRDIRVTVEFGGTELHVTSEDLSKANGDKKKCQLEFFSTPSEPTRMASVRKKLGEPF